MIDTITSFAGLPLEIFDNPSTGDAWESCALADLSDEQLVESAIAAIMPPKLARPSSFVLHAPLELMARSALLPLVRPNAKSQARRQIAALAVRYIHAGPSAETPQIRHTEIETALPALIDSLHCGDVDGADSALLSLTPRLSIFAMRKALIDEIAPLLSAAGHAPILLASLARTTHANAIGLLRAPLRTLAASPKLRLTWFNTNNENVKPGEPVDEHTLFARLVAPPHVASPSTSIAPMALAVEQSGDAARLLAQAVQDFSAQQTEQILLRIAAYSMLQDNPAEAPYGWTHCLTLPQGLLRNADASSNHRALIAVAATHVLANRAISGRVAINAAAPPKTSRQKLDDANPTTAASIAFHTPIERRKEIMTELATYASTHHDAHLAKYTLACFEAAANDPDAAPLFMAAAAYLGAWWRYSTRA
jgi:hypothetical protein